MNFKYFEIRALVPLILVLALIFQPLSNAIEQSIGRYDNLREIVKYIEALSTIGMITLFLTFINYWGWKWRIFKWLIDIPNLNGRYNGKLVSSYKDLNGNNVIKDCVLEIKQTASKITIDSYYGDLGTSTTSSRSYTTSEQFIKEHNGFFTLYYIFTNEPDTLSTQLSNHAGTARLKYYPDKKTLEGDYYNRRLNEGTIEVKFEQKRLLGRLIP